MLSSHGSNYFSAALPKHGIPDVDTIEIVSMGCDGVRVCVCVCGARAQNGAKLRQGNVASSL